MLHNAVLKTLLHGYVSLLCWLEAEQAPCLLAAEMHTHRRYYDIFLKAELCRLSACTPLTVQYSSEPWVFFSATPRITSSKEQGTNILRNTITSLVASKRESQREFGLRSSVLKTCYE